MLYHRVKNIMGKRQKGRNMKTGDLEYASIRHEHENGEMAIGAKKNNKRDGTLHHTVLTVDQVQKFR